MKKLLFLIAFCITSVTSYAQKESNFSASLELTTKYMWRGIEYGDAPVAFPMLSYDIKGFNAFAMGGYAVNGSHAEVDLGVSYTKDWITVGLSDYYYPTAVGAKDNYSNFKSRDTGHYVELYTTLQPIKKVPLSFTCSVYVFGADKKEDNKQAFSSYVEAEYTHSFKDDNAISVTLGATLNKSFYTDYESGANVVNLGVKYATAFNFDKFKLPVSAAYIYNPWKDKSFFTFSLYIK